MAEYADKVMAELKAAMKAKDTERRNTIRLIQSAFKQVQIDEQRELTAEDELNILKKEAKKRRESIEELKGAGRETDAEEFELEVIDSFLPVMMTREEIEVLAKDAIAETGADSPKEMGKVIGLVMSKTDGRADGSDVSAVVRELLSQ
jgi:uncharacterized protein YqeY